MDANSEKKAIGKQNKEWAQRKQKKRNLKSEHHPWYYTAHLVKSRIDQLANFDINNNEIKRD
jgi:hypothetical protein